MQKTGIKSIDKIKINSYANRRNIVKAMNEKVGSILHDREGMQMAESIPDESAFEVPSGADRMN